MINFNEWRYNEANKPNKSSKLQEFAETRLKGAEKISKEARSKGGMAILTAYHFDVKLEYYRRAAAGKTDRKSLEKEYRSLLSSLNNPGSMPKKTFQENVGRLEVVGELIQAHKDFD